MLRAAESLCSSKDVSEPRILLLPIFGLNYPANKYLDSLQYVAALLAAVFN